MRKGVKLGFGLIVFLVFGVGLVGLFATESGQAWLADLRFGEQPPPATTTVTLPATTLTTIVTHPPATEPIYTLPIITTEAPMLFEGKGYAGGSFGIYDPDGRPIKIQQFQIIFNGDGEPPPNAGYFQANVSYCQIVGGSGLDPASLVVYFRSQIIKADGSPVKIVPDIILYKGDFHLEGCGISSLQSVETSKWGTVSLKNHWFGWFEPEKMNKDTKQEVSINGLYTKAGIPIDQKHTFELIHETIFDCWSFDGRLFSATSRQKLWVEITPPPQMIGYHSVTSVSSAPGGIAAKVWLLIGVGLLVIILQREGKLKKLKL